ncbi:ABC transporter permease [Nakamurella lactea]|uniref:ABC transporter permease n=1 Tax=Nakamurella lactea TaxID=459515 RepID=UPI000426F6EA|nr:ABC transporter permease [Nakamurella lactea]
MRKYLAGVAEGNPAEPTDPAAKPTIRSLSRTEWALFGALLIGLVVLFALASPYFLSAGNMSNLFTTMALAGILAAPATFLMVAGQVDLSVGATAAICGVVLAGQAQGLGLAGSIVLSAAVGIVIGLTNGVLVAVLGIPSLAVTVGSLAMVRGLAYLLPSGQVVPIAGFGALGNARPLLNIPLPVLILVVVLVSAGIILRYTAIGRGTYRVGGRPALSRLHTVRAKVLVVGVFAASGAAAALVGMIITSQLSTAVPNVADGVELTVLTAVLLGGASLSGGRGTVAGTALALLILNVLDNGLSLLNVTSYWQQFASGALLLLALLIDRVRWYTRHRRWSRRANRAGAAEAAPAAGKGAPANTAANTEGEAANKPGDDARRPDPADDQPGRRAGITRYR